MGKWPRWISVISYHESAALASGSGLPASDQPPVRLLRKNSRGSRLNFFRTDRFRHTAPGTPAIWPAKNNSQQQFSPARGRHFFASFLLPPGPKVRRGAGRSAAGFDPPASACHKALNHSPVCPLPQSGYNQTIPPRRCAMPEAPLVEVFFDYV